ncbi:MAG: SLC13 family permease [Pseudomonadales bacterium]
MTPDQWLILGIIIATVIMFLWGRWRHDLVALIALLACVFTGLVPAGQAFFGFSHPAVITVAAVLVLSQGLRNTGVIDVLAQRVLPSAGGITLGIFALTGLGALLSAFMNNVGAMALLMPVAMQLADKHQLPPGKILMPLAFATILGGMTTLIGTPPNLIVSGFRAEAGLESFSMFDFMPVGSSVAIVGVFLVAIGGWRLVPAREKTDAASFETGTYLTEVRVTEDSKAAGLTIEEAEQKLTEADAQIVGMVRSEFRIITPIQTRVLKTGDILIIEAEPESLSTALSILGVKLEQGIEEETDEGVESEQSADEDEDTGEKEEKESRYEEGTDAVIRELVAMPHSTLIGQTAEDIFLRERYGLNLLAVSRQGRRSIKRLRSTTIQAGDVLLLQGLPQSLSAFSSEFGSVPLAERAVSVPDTAKATTAMLVMVAAVAGAAFGLIPAAIAFVAGLVVFVIRRVVPPADLYDAIDWPVIVLLGALLPVAGAMASTGAADLLAQWMLNALTDGDPIMTLGLILVLTMGLSDFMNNAATAAVMCPIAISVASQLGVTPDAFLMAVAIGASCAMLTPIGHQNNTLILGPGGFRFGDYWRLGLPLEILVIIVSIPMLLIVWPL